ncbi:MAG TPA: HAD family phosphatase [Acidimicrobiales bacterium]|nr:HAD family phosphatase [Acidimicrobiales bacterium]
MIAAVLFDLDGVLIDSEVSWDEARRAVVARHGGRWIPGATEAMQGMSAPEWSAYLRDRAGLDLDTGAIVAEVLEALTATYAEHLPVIPGALEAVRRIASCWPVALCTSANRVVIDDVLARTGLAETFAVSVSSEEVARGKPAPDVYLEGARRLGAEPSRCVVIEDSANGIRAGVAAGMLVVAIPNREFPPPAEVLDAARLVLATIGDLTAEVVRAAADAEAALDEDERESFPASDPHSDWAGPPG